MEPQNKTPGPNAGGQNKNVETYAEDMAKVLESNETGLIRKIIHQEEQEEMEKKNLSPESKKNRLFMLSGFVLLFLAASALAYLMLSKEKIGTVPVEMQYTPLIFTDKTAFIEIASFPKEQVAQSVLGEVNVTDVKAGGVEAIYLTENKQIIGWPRFLQIIKAALTKTNIFEDKFLLGVANQDTKDVFFLLSIRSFTDVFNEMHVWEGKMFFDLHDFFGVAANPTTNYLLTKDFEDGIIQNKNARILYDDAEEIVFMYVFIDDNYLVITDTEAAVREVMLRLAGSGAPQQ